MRPEVTEKMAQLPATPGVYLMRDAHGEVFYIGKAKSLRDRVRSYLSGADSRAFVALLDNLLWDVEVILTGSEKEALLLENELIKEHQPRFNVILKDDKRYLCLRLDTRQAHPRLEVVRRFASDGARYFGPYHSAQAIRQTLRIINRHFQLRTCSDTVLRSRSRPCLQYQIKRCPAPCVFALEEGEYEESVDNVITFLEGRGEELLESLRRRMRAQAAVLNYEVAAQVRDQVQAVERSLEQQRVVSPQLIDRDAVGIYREGTAVEIHIIRAERGHVIDAQRFSFDEQEAPTTEILSDFAVRYYSEQKRIPDEILFPGEMEWSEALEELLSETRGRAARVRVPKRGEKRRLVEMANSNAAHAFTEKQRREGAARAAIARLHKALHLPKLPVRIECFDVSHLQGEKIVASAVRFDAGAPRKELYRHYKVRSTLGQDDFKSMYEVLSRRARRGVEEGDLPDLIVIDGGKGQLAAARAALEDHGVGADDVGLVALAKSRRRGSGESAEIVPERVFVQGQKNPVVLRDDSAEQYLLVRARNEAHRFAISFHRQLRGKSRRRSALDDIEGIGPTRRRKLLAHFGSVRRLQAAAESDVAAVVGKQMARRVLEALREPEEG